MASLNKVILIGHMTADPELKQTPSGVSVCSFSIGVRRKAISSISLHGDSKLNSLHVISEKAVRSASADLFKQDLGTQKTVPSVTPPKLSLMRSASLSVRAIPPEQMTISLLPLIRAV